MPPLRDRSSGQPDAAALWRWLWASIRPYLGYILIAIRFEESDLEDELGHAYRDYRRKVPMLVPFTHGFSARLYGSRNDRKSLQKALASDAQGA